MYHGQQGEFVDTGHNAMAAIACPARGRRQLVHLTRLACVFLAPERQLRGSHLDHQIIRIVNDRVVVLALSLDQELVHLGEQIGVCHGDFVEHVARHPKQHD